MEKKSDGTAGQSKKGAADDGLFTGRLTWWQILLGLLLVAFLVYGKYKEVVAQPAAPPVSAPAKAK